MSLQLGILVFLSELALPAAGQDPLHVRVVLAAPAPDAPVVLVDRNPEHCGVSLADPVLLVGPQGGVRNALVWIEDAPPESTAVVAAADIQVVGEKCLMHPRVQAARVGTRIRLGNADGVVSHDFHGWLGDRTKFRLTLLNSSYEFKRKLVDEGIYRIDCDTHKWMKAYVAVFAHSYYGVTAEDGVVEIAGLPPGEYSLRIWHEVLGELAQPVTLVAGGPNALTVELELRDVRPAEQKPPTQSPWPPSAEQGDS